MKYKKILIILLSIIVVVGSGLFVVYSVYFKDRNLKGDFIMCQKKTFKDIDAYIPCKGDEDCQYDSIKKYCDPFPFSPLKECFLVCGKNNFCEQECNLLKIK